MAYTPHTLVEFGGTLTEVAGQDEIWSCSIRGLNNAGTNPTPNPEGLMASLVTPLQQWFTEANSYCASTATLTQLKVNNIGADGKYSSGTSNIHVYAPGIAGTVNPTAPSFLSVALSWITANPRGRAHTGRIYPPNYAATLNVGSTINPTVQANLAHGGTDLLQLLIAPGLVDDQKQFQAEVMSKIDGSHHRVTGCRVGNVWDYQSRRKNAVRETYVARALT